MIPENMTAIVLAPAMILLRNSVELYTDMATWAAERGEADRAERLRELVATKRERLRVLEGMAANDAI